GLLVRVESQPAAGLAHITGRRVVEQLAPARLVQECVEHPRAQEVQLGFTHDPLGTWNIMHKLQIPGHPGGGRSFASSGLDAGRGPGSGRCVMASGKEMSHGSFSNSPRANGSLWPPPGRTSRARLSP